MMAVMEAEVQATHELTTAERAELGRYEKVIERGIDAFMDVGSALIAIRDDKLYRATHGTFEDYCRARWDMSRSYAYRTIGAAEVIENLSPIGDILPVNEAQTRPLVKLEPEQQREAWADAVEHAPDGKPTAAAVTKAAAKFSEPKATPTRADVKRLRDASKSLVPTPAKAVYVEPVPNPATSDGLIAKLRHVCAGLVEADVLLDDLIEMRQGWYHDLLLSYIPLTIEPEVLARAAKLVRAERTLINEEAAAIDPLIRDLCEAGRVTEPFIVALRTATVEQLEAALRQVPQSDQYRWLKIGKRRELLEAARWANQLEATVEDAFPSKAEFAAVEAAVEASITPAAAEKMSESAERARLVREELVLPATRDDGRLEDARMLRDLLVAARDTARAHYSELTGRDTDLLLFERSVEKMVEPLESLIAILERGG